MPFSVESAFGLIPNVKIEQEAAFGGQSYTGEIQGDTLPGTEAEAWGENGPKQSEPSALQKGDLAEKLKDADKERLFIRAAAFLLLGIHWFNPCIWLSYKLLGRDIELACDELVIRN